MTLQTHRPGRTTRATPPGRWLMLVVLLLGQFMCVIDMLVSSRERDIMSGQRGYRNLARGSPRTRAHMRQPLALWREREGLPPSCYASPHAQRLSAAGA